MQNGSISCIALPEALPGGVRGVLAENLLASMLGMACASGNDALASHSALRKTAKLMLQMIPGTDFICSGYSAIPKQDNMFGGGNFDAEDFDDWTVIQRDMQVNGGIRPVREADAVAVRRQAAQALQAIYAELDFPSIGDEEVEAATLAHSSEDMPERDMVATWPQPTASWVVQPIWPMWCARCTVAASSRWPPICWRWAVSGWRATICSLRAIFEDGFAVLSAINDCNDYTGPGTGYRLEGETWDVLQRIPQQKSPREFIDAQVGDPLPNLAEVGTAKAGNSANEIVVAGRAGLWPLAGEDDRRN